MNKKLFKQIYFRAISFINSYLKFFPLLFYKTTEEKSCGKNIVLFDTALKTKNLGDEIIVFYCKENLINNNLIITNSVPTHIKPNKNELKYLNDNEFKIITGTNIISAKENKDYLWLKPKLKYIEHFCLMGCGANNYEKKLNFYSQLFYRKLLSKSFIHSVRDSFTENLLKSIGITNVINTSCPTMWKLTPEFCKSIPTKKATIAVTTLTDYEKDFDNDFYLLDTLLKNYEKVFIWIQGDEDYEYLKNYKDFEKLNIIGHTLKEYEQFLISTNCDYIGTRLHAGIRALNEKKRTLILAVDDRALQISKDTNLPVIRRSNIKKDLEKIILNEYHTDIKIPLENIEKWKNQFNMEEKK